MRIAFLVDRFPVLSETFIINEIGGAIERGHDVTILALAAGPESAVMHPDVHRLGMLDRTSYLGIPRRVDRRAASLARILWHHRSNAGAVWRRYDRRRFGEGGDRGKFIHQALRLVALRPFDVIHCQFGLLGLIGQRFRACGILQGRLVTTFRGHDVSRFLRERGERVYDDLFREGDWFLTNCAFFRDRLRKLGCDPARLSVQHSGVDTRRFSFRPRQAPEDGRVIIATVGRLVEKKGVADCLNAAALLARDHPRVDYRILGDGPLREELERQTDQLNLRDRVTFLGAGSQDAVIDLLDRAHVFLAPSVTAANGDQDAPINTLKEAMAMGLPVVSTRHGGIPELVHDGIVGHLVPERDPEALAAALRRLFDGADRWPEMGRAGRAIVEAEWDRDRLNERLDAVYRRLAGDDTPLREVTPSSPSHKAEIAGSTAHAPCS